MLRTCPKCGAFYAESPTAFCLADGTPLAGLDSSSETWTAAERAVREQGEAARKHSRRLRRRRVWTTVTTLVMMTMVVFVIVTNAYLYLNPTPDESTPAPALASALLPADEPAGGGDGGPANVNVNVNVNANVNLNANRNANARVNEDVCTAADRKREGSAVESQHREKWFQYFFRQQREAMARNPRLWFRAEPVPGELNFKPTFTNRTCTAASVKVWYVWEGREPSPDDRVRTVPVRYDKKFTCEKARREWRCR